MSHPRYDPTRCCSCLKAEANGKGTEVSPATPRPSVDDRVDEILAEHLSPQHHRMWWMAEASALGGMTPFEALKAGQREAVIELALGMPGSDPAIALIGREQANDMLERLGPLFLPYEI